MFPAREPMVEAHVIDTSARRALGSSLAWAPRSFARAHAPPPHARRPISAAARSRAQSRTENYDGGGPAKDRLLRDRRVASCTRRLAGKERDPAPALLRLPSRRPPSRRRHCPAAIRQGTRRSWRRWWPSWKADASCRLPCSPPQSSFPSCKASPRRLLRRSAAWQRTSCRQQVRGQQGADD